MTARKSLPGRLSRLSTYSIQSQVSGVLDPDSNLISDDESHPFWSKDFENHSINVRPSARFSLVQNDSPVLDPNSEPDTTPLRKSWYKVLENTPDVRPKKTKNTETAKESNDVTDKSRLESSDTSSLDNVVAKRRIVLRRNKRKSLQNNVFSEILDTERPSTSSEGNNNRNVNKNQKNLDSADISPSDTDISLEKVKKLPFKKKKRTKLGGKSSNNPPKFDANVPDVFQRVLDASQSSNDSRRQSMPQKEHESSMRNQEEEAPGSDSHRIISDEPEEVVLGGEDLEGTRSPVIMSRPKKRTIFSKTIIKRRTANFDELLNNESEDEEISGGPLNQGELESNKNDNERVESVAAQPSPGLDLQSNVLDDDGDTDSEESIKKQRVRFPTKKRKSHIENRFPQSLQSPNTSVRSEPAIPNRTGELESSKRQIPLSDIERRFSKRKSNPAQIPGTPNPPLEENQSPRKLSRLSNNLNKSSTQKNDAAEISRRSNVPVEENQSPNIQNRFSSHGNRSAMEKRSMNEENDRQESSGSSDIELEDDESLGEPIHQSSIRNKSGAARHSINRKNDPVENSRPTIIEFEESGAADKPTRPSISGNKSGRQSMNEKNENAETSHRSNVLLEENQSENVPDRSSRRGNRSGTKRLSINEENDLPESSGPSDVEFEEQESLDQSTHRSSIKNKSGAGGQSTNKKNDHAENSRPKIIENRSVNIQIRPLTKSDKSAVGRRSMNKKKEDKETSRSLNIEGEEEEEDEDESAEIAIPQSISFKKPSDPDQDKNSSTNKSLGKDTSHRISEKSVNKELPEEFTDEEGDNEAEEIFNTVKDLSYISEDRSQDIPQPRETSRGDNRETTVPVHSKDETADQRKTRSRSKSKSRSKVITDGKENTGIHESRASRLSRLSHGVRNGTERSFSSFDNEGSRSVQQTETSFREKEGSQGLNIEKLTQIKSALEEVKKKELASMKNAKIDSYFKKVSSTKPDGVTASNSQKILKRNTKPVPNARKTAPRTIDKAYLVNGQVYHRPKLPRPKSWATDRLYNFLWKKMEPKYKLRARIRSEKFIMDLSRVVTLISRRKVYKNYREELNELIHEMARLDLIKTRNDFSIFCQDFLPFQFREKVVPMLLPGNVRNIPFKPNQMHEPILKL